MEVEDQQRVIGDITQELQEISSSLDKYFTGLSEKQFYDKDLSKTIKETIETVFAKKVDSKYYDENLGEKISAAIAEASGKISLLKLDVSPVMKIGFEMIKQVKSMIDAFVNMPKPETNDDRYEGMLTLMIDALKKNNEMLGRIAIQQSSQTHNSTEKREVESWEFVHFRDNDRIKSTKAIPKYKK
jgi:non-homologous end joining protein Ku